MATKFLDYTGFDYFWGQIKNRFATDSSVMHLAGTETVTGTKTFNSISVATPTLNTHAVNKAYVDGLVGDIEAALEALL